MQCFELFDTAAVHAYMYVECVAGMSANFAGKTKLGSFRDTSLSHPLTSSHNDIMSSQSEDSAAVGLYTAEQAIASVNSNTLASGADSITIE